MEWERYAQYGRELARAEVDDEGVLDVPSGFLGDKSTSPLMVRESYLDLEKQIERVMGMQLPPFSRRRTPCLRPQFHVVGSRGIGKTYFGYYWFHKQAMLRRKAIWVRMELDQPCFLYYDFSLEDPSVLRACGYLLPHGWREADLSTTWLVVDGPSKGVPHHGPILQCVADMMGCHEFSKDGVVLGLGDWSLEELEKCNTLLELHFSSDELSRRFERFGGVPREVLDGRIV